MTGADKEWKACFDRVGRRGSIEAADLEREAYGLRILFPRNRPRAPVRVLACALSALRPQYETERAAVAALERCIFDGTLQVEPFDLPPALSTTRFWDAYHELCRVWDGIA